MTAPSLTPVRPGMRMRTGRRDARKLAESLCAGRRCLDGIDTVMAVCLAAERHDFQCHVGS